MSSYTPEELNKWEGVIHSLRESMVPVSYKTWIEPLRLHSVTPDSILIIADNYITLNHVRKRYYTQIYGLVRVFFGRTYELLFYTQEELSRAGDLSTTSLNRRYSFENFIVGASNSFAYSASLAVAETPAEAYNPLFIYGSVGLGKTHLMNAIGNYIEASEPTMRVLLTTAESITNELIEGVIKRDTSGLRNRMRSADVLMIDDIQYISKSKSVQDEIFHAFNDLHAEGKQIVLASDRPPREIASIEERLRSRFEWGLIVDIQKPDLDTRIAILRRKAIDESIDVSPDVIEYIARNVESNIRELEGTLNRLNAHSRLMGSKITMELAEELLSPLMELKAADITPRRVIDAVCAVCGVTREDMLSKKRTREIALPRQMAMYLLREMTQLSTTLVGAELGGRDHTTVMHGCEKIAEDLKKDYELSRKLEEIRKKVKEG